MTSRPSFRRLCLSLLLLSSTISSVIVVEASRQHDPTMSLSCQLSADCPEWDNLPTAAPTTTTILATTILQPYTMENNLNLEEVPVMINVPKRAKSNNHDDNDSITRNRSPGPGAAPARPQRKSAQQRFHILQQQKKAYRQTLQKQKRQQKHQNHIQLATTTTTAKAHANLQKNKEEQHQKRSTTTRRPRRRKQNAISSTPSTQQAHLRRKLHQHAGVHPPPGRVVMPLVVVNKNTSKEKQPNNKNDNIHQQHNHEQHLVLPQNNNIHPQARVPSSYLLSDSTSIPRRPRRGVTKSRRRLP